MIPKTLILLSSVGNLSQALKITGKAGVLIIALDEAARHAAQEANVPYHMSSEYLKLSETELRDCADAFSRQWYIAGESDYSQFDGNSLGELVYIEVSNKALFELGRAVILIQELNAVHHPERWILATDKEKQLSQVINSITKRQVEIKRVSPSLFEWLRRYINLRELKLWLRREGLDYYLRALVFRLTRSQKSDPLKTLPCNENPLSVFVVDIPNPSVMGTLVPLMRMMPQDDQLTIASDPRCQKVLEGHGIDAVPFQAENFGLSQPQLPPGFQRELKRRWNSIINAARHNQTNMVFRGVDLWIILQPYFRKMFLRRLPLAFKHIYLASEILGKCHARALILAADNTYIGQIFVLAAKKQGIYSLTVQHGMVNHPKGYLPIRTTQMAVMGEAVKDWLIHHGARPEQLVVTGQPRFDELIDSPKIPREQIFSDLDLQVDKPVWLIAPDWHLGLWMRELVLDGLEHLPDVQAIIRVHPNDNPLDYEMALKYRPGLISRVRISRQHDVTSVLKSCDAVILGRSTIGLEAMLVGVHVIGVRPASEIGWIVPPYLEEFLDDAPFLCVNNPDDLGRAWQEINNPENYELLSVLRDRIIQRYACAVDGKNSDRVLDAIFSGTRNTSQSHNNVLREHS